MKILIITFDPPENVGGIEGRVNGLLKELPKHDVRVTVVALARNYSFEKGSYLGAPYFKVSSDPSELLDSFFEITRLCVSQSIDSVFLLSGATTLLGNMLLAGARLMRIRSAVLFYGKDILQANKSLLSKLLLLASLFSTKKVLANSRFTASLLPYFARLRAATLYPSVDARDKGLSAKGYAPERIVLFVGRLVERKGVSDLLHAILLVKDDVPQVRLEIVGDGPERKKLERISSDLGISRLITFFGELRGKELYRRYQLCAVFAMPSKTLKDDVEGFGTVFLEAGLFGKPSVGTNSGGIPEALLDGKTGLLVDEGNVPALAMALKTLLKDEEFARRLGENARKRVLSNFTWQSGARRLIEVLENKT
jgi:phosphatidylinositol alpha-1,6-mannosyltransferase